MTGAHSPSKPVEFSGGKLNGSAIPNKDETMVNRLWHYSPLYKPNTGHA